MVLAILAHLISLHSSEKRGKNNSAEINAYDDIDLFQLKGIKKIENPVSYPYVKIENLKNKKRIVYKRSGTDSVERVYRKENNYWTTSYTEKVDTGYFNVYEFITAEKITNVSFAGTLKKSDFYLSDISIHEKNRIVT